MPQLHRLPLFQALLFGPGDKFIEQHRISSLSVLGLAAFMTQVLQKIFKFRTCTLEITEADEKWRWFRPCLLANINQCTAPCNLRISKEEYRKDIHRLRMFLEGQMVEVLTR